MMARTVRTEKVAAVWKVAAEYGSCWATWMVVEAMGMSWDMCMFNKWSVHGPWEV